MAPVELVTIWRVTAANTPALDRYFGALQQLGYVPGNVRFYVKYLFKGIDFTGKTMLDVGAGDGRFSYYAACAGASRVVSLEPEAAGSGTGRVDKFKRLASLVDQPQVEFVPVPLQEYTHEDGLFDVLLLHASINHLDEEACVRLHEDPAAQETYLGIFRILASLARPGGVLIVTDCARRNLFGDLGVRNPIARTIEWHKHQSPELWAELLTRVGFVRPDIRWTTFNTLRSPGRLLLGNRVAAYCLTSSFRLAMERSGAASANSAADG